MRRIGLLVIAALALLLLALPAVAQDEPAPDLSGGNVTYTVRYGDVLDVIAASFDVSVECIAEASGLDNPNRLRIGDVLLIRADCPRYTGLNVVTNPRVAPDAADDEADEGQGGGAVRRASGGGDVYVVAVGDVLDLIAASFDVDVTCLAAANDLPRGGGRIFPGDEISIDLTCPPYAGQAFVPNPREDPGALGQGGGGVRRYTVRFGDVADIIAASNNVSLACMAQVSGIENLNRIRPGDVLVIDPTCPPYVGAGFVPPAAAGDAG